ncbi:dTDP-4-dehydrorhamnose reductase [Pseudomonadota bacterium]
MRLLITGCLGQVGSELVRQALSLGWEVKAADRDELDITDADTVNRMIHDVKPDVVINAAAYTAVDIAEDDVDAAFAVNRDGPVNLAVACEEQGALLVHYSTDYVFDGSKGSAYHENDAVAPLGVYGESKLEGELAVAKSCAKHLILRTSWVFSVHGNNFVKTMLRLGSEREELGVVADQFGKPTSAAEIARITLAILPHAEGHWGIYHLAQPESISWHGFSKTIFAEAEKQKWPLKVKHVKEITTEDYPTPAKRPANSEFNCEKLERVFGVQIKPWGESLSEVIKELNDV